jgi:hypothetical protein
MSANGNAPLDPADGFMLSDFPVYYSFRMKLPCNFCRPELEGVTWTKRVTQVSVGVWHVVCWPCVRRMGLVEDEPQKVAHVCGMDPDVVVIGNGVELDVRSFSAKLQQLVDERQALLAHALQQLEDDERQAPHALE